MTRNYKKIIILVILIIISLAVIYDIFSSNYSACAASDLERELESYISMIFQNR